MSRTILGIDEAGRGAVLGPLVMAGVLFKDEDDIFEALQQIGVCDSKLATIERRGELAKVIRRLKIRHLTFKIYPRLIDTRSVNALEIDYSSRLIIRLKPHTVYLDVPASGVGVQNYCASIEALSTHQCEIRGGNRFDRTNVAVAAASIIAKEEREAAVRKLHRKYGNFGSGYPHDPRTKEWLKLWRRKNDDWPEIVRTKWTTITRSLDHKITRSRDQI